MIYDEIIKKSSRLYYLFFVLLMLGTVLGSVFYVNRYSLQGNIKTYMDSCIIGVRESGDFKAIAIGTIKNNAWMMGIMLIGSLFKPGIILIAAQIIRRGFIIGFTSCALFGTYGMSSVYAVITMIPQSILAAPAIVLLAAVLTSAAMGKNTEKDKKFYIFYIIFLILIFTIFCITAFAEGYLSTIFMGKTINSVT